MNGTDESLARSLTADSTELIPYLPYLLQDLYELGSSPETIVDLLKRNASIDATTRVLDLACGKGAVSIALARAFPCLVLGIDLMSAFVDDAVARARLEGVEERCRFQVEDIHATTSRKETFDIVIYGAVGDVLGTPSETLAILRNVVKVGGWLVLDDAYGLLEGDSRYLTKKAWRKTAGSLGWAVVEDIVVTDDELDEVGDLQLTQIGLRAAELKQKHPEKAALFDGYVKSQHAECDELKQAIDGVTLLLRRVR